MSVEEDQKLRQNLEAQALGGASWLDLVVTISSSAGCLVRLAAADAALLCEAGGERPLELADAETFDSSRPRILESDDVAAAFAAAGPVHMRALDGVAMRGLAIASGGRRVGVLLVEQSCPSADALLRAAATAVAIVAVRRDAQASAVAETAAWFVDELRFGSRRTDDELAALALRFGVRLGEPQTPCVIDYDGPDRTFATALSWVESPLRVDGQRAWTVLGADAVPRARLIRRRLQEFVSAGRVLVACGPASLGVEAIRAGFDKAGFTLRMLAAREDCVDGGTFGGGRVRDGVRGTPSPVGARGSGWGSAERADGVATFDELGLAGLLFQVPAQGLSAFAHARLAPILAHPELLQTLRAWYASGGSRLAVAAAVHIHRNSVGHRMERLRTLLGVDPSDPAVALELQTALAALDVLAALDEQ